MSRGSTLIVLGSAWTQIALAVICIAIIPELAFAVPILPLSSGLFVAAVFFLFGGAVRSAALRETGLFLHLSLSLGWVLWGSIAAGASLAADHWLLVLLATLVGAAMSSLGAQMGLDAPEPTVQQILDVREPLIRVSPPVLPRLRPSDFDSGVVRIR